MVGPELYYDDFQVDDIFEYGSHRVTEEEILSFARQWDPQRFHLDPDVAEQTMFGGLVASGLHTLCICCRMAVDELFSRTAVMGGIGFDRIRFPQPVRPGDELSGRVQIVRTESADRHPDGGYVDFEVIGENGDGQTVISLVDLALVERRGGDG